jgi:hypothetical protein
LEKPVWAVFPKVQLTAAAQAEGAFQNFASFSRWPEAQTAAAAYSALVWFLTNEDHSENLKCTPSGTKHLATKKAPQLVGGRFAMLQHC